MAVVAATACGGQYAAEKAYWKADRVKKNIQKSPKGTPTGLYVKAREAFQEVRSQFPKSLQAEKAQLDIAELYALEGNSSLAEEEFRKIVRDHSGENKADIRFQAQWGLARLWEKGDDWDKALEQYRKTFDEHETQPAALVIPLHIARHYLRKNDEKWIPEVYDNAVDLYDRLAKKYPRSPLALSCLKFTYQCHADREEWNMALATLRAIRETFPGSPDAQSAVSLRVQILKKMKKTSEGDDHEFKAG